jgi:hypothetical protein
MGVRDGRNRPPRLRVPGFGVFEERVEACHISNREALAAVEKTALEDVSAERGPKRIEGEAADSDRPLSRNYFRSGQRGVAIEGTEMV